MKTTLLKSGLKLSVLSMLFLISACLTEDEPWNPELPPITQTGENTFGCYVDGQLLLPRDRRVFWGPTIKGMTMSEYSSTPSKIDFFNLRVIDGKTDVGFLSFYFYNLNELGEGTYSIKQGYIWQTDAEISTTNFWIKSPRYTSKRYLSIKDSGTLTITRYDYVNGIISGTFNCKVINDNDSSEIIQITDGRFDINLNTLNDTEFP